MKATFRITLGACAVAAVALMAAAPADARCSRASAMGFGLGPEMSKNMAKMNLDAGIAAKGQKAKGKIAYKCSGPFECKASRRAC
jgi:hypothetical protein